MYIMAAGYVLAGINHFINPRFYIKMIEDFLPYAAALVILSGIAEIICGLGFFIPQTRVWAAWGTIALLIAIYPANIYMTMHPEKFHFPLWGLYLRLPIQLLLIWAAYVYTRS